MSRLYRTYINLHLILAASLLVSAWFFPIDGRAEVISNDQWDSFITNYGKADYGKGAQTWQILTPDRRFAFFANQRGVLEYSAGRWSTLTLGNGQDARSLLVDPQQRRLYAGGINIFGYFATGDNGQMVFTQLNKGFEDLINYPGNVWGIYKLGQTLYIHADVGIIRYDLLQDTQHKNKHQKFKDKVNQNKNHKVNLQATILPTQGHPEYVAVLDQGLYITTENGIYVLIGEEFIPLHNTDQIGSYRIRGLRKVGSKIYAITASHGIFECDGVSVKPFPTMIDDYIKNNEVFCWANSGDHYALGTIRGGLVVIDKEGLNPKYYNEDNGLQDNTVLSLAFDPSGNLWAGMDRGIDYIHLNSPLSKLPLTSESIGMGYAAALYKGTLYLGTNRGLYWIDWETALKGINQSPNRIPQVSGQVWNLVETNGMLLCCSDHGLFTIDGDKTTKVEGLPAIWTVMPVEGEKDQLWAGGYNGLWKLRIISEESTNSSAPGARNVGNVGKAGKVGKVGKKKNEIEVEGMLTDASDSFMSFAHLRNPQENTLWLSNNGIIIRLDLTQDMMNVKKRTNYPSAFANVLDVSIQNGIPTFSSSEGLWCYDSQKDQIVPISSKIYSKAAEITDASERLVSTSGSDLEMESTLRNTFTAELVKTLMSPYEPFTSSLIESVTNFERVIPLTANLSIVPDDAGFALYSQAVQEDDPELFAVRNPLLIKEIYAKAVKSPEDSIVYRASPFDPSEGLRIPHSHNSLVFAYGASPASLDKAFKYQSRLDNGKWSVPSTTQHCEYVDISPGNHRMSLRAIDPHGSISEASLEFTILRPWYRSAWAYLCYFIVFCILAFVLRQFEIRHRRKLESKVQKEKNREIEQITEQYENEKAAIESEKAAIESEKAAKELQIEQITEEFESEKAAKDQQIEQLEKENLQQKLNQTNLEMANALVNVLRKNEILTSIKKDISGVLERLPNVKQTEGVRQDLLSITESIASNIQGDNVLKKVEGQFDIVHNNFMKKIKELHPELNVNERMMCAYLKMNLSTKEIASLFNISVRGTETVRYRLRKKLNLQRDESLTDYLNRL